MVRKELKSKDFIIKDLLQTIKEIKTKSVSVQSIPLCMSSSELTYYQQIIQLLLKMFIKIMSKQIPITKILFPTKKYK